MMSEYSPFDSIKEELDRKESEEQTTIPKTTEKPALPVRIHHDSFRANIGALVPQEKSLSTDAGAQAEIRRIQELVSPGLFSEYREIFRALKKKTKKSEEHPNRERIDLKNEDVSLQIDGWISKLKMEIVSHDADMTSDDIESIEMSAWMFFDSLADAMNARSLESDVKEFLSVEKLSKDTPEKERNQKLEGLSSELCDRYGVSLAEARVLILVAGKDDLTESEYGMQKIAETLSKVWGQYGVGKHKKELGKISLGYMTSRGMQSFAPSLFEGMIEGDKLRADVAAGYFGLQFAGEYVEMKTDIVVEKLMLEIRQEINKRITDSLFFHEFEFIHEKSLGEVFGTLERGKQATIGLIQGAVTQLAPSIFGVSASLAFLTKINPLLGAIGLSGIPIMWHIAKKHSKETSAMYKEEIQKEEILDTRVAAFKSGYEEVKTIPDISHAAGVVRDQIDQLDSLTQDRFIKEMKNQFKRMLPHNISSWVALAVGAVFQEMGKISGGAILSNMQYTHQITQPIDHLASLYFDRFPRHIQNIDRMNEVFGEYEKLDRPEGEKEKGRTPISQLQNCDISIENLGYKGVLQGIDLMIPQGEFVTIAGETGKGKTTLLRNIAGLFRPTNGRIVIGGVPIGDIQKYGDRSLYSMLAYCNQKPQIIPNLSLRENISLWTKAPHEDDEIRDILKKLRLEKFSEKLDESVKYLSGGELVRIGLARVLLKKPKILLLDEPTASLDSGTGEEVRQLIADIHATNPDVTIVCVSHDEKLLALGDRRISL